MSTVLVGTAKSQLFNREILERMYSLRHRVFHERLQWQVNSINNMECDDYDLLEPVYVVAKNSQNAVLGCWRFLSSTGPYMLTHTFPELLRGEDAPHDKRVLEISRFAVNTDLVPTRSDGSLNDTTLALLRAGYQYAVCSNVTHFVAVTSVATERLLKKAGIPMRRFGDGKAQNIGGVLSVACWVEVNEQYRHAVSVVDTGYRALLEAA